MFRVGQKVVCVDAKSPPIHVPSGDCFDLRAGMILTVAAAYHHPHVDKLMLQFSELPVKNSAGGDRWYQASRFRPIVSRPTSIEFAHEILRSVSAPTKERAINDGWADSLPVPDVTELDVAFGNIKHMPRYDTLPAEFKRHNENGYCKAMSAWFFKGAAPSPNGIKIDGVTFTAKAGVDARKAIAAIGAILVSFEPKREHKEAGCAYLLSQWFDISASKSSEPSHE